LGFVDRHGKHILNRKLETTELVWELCSGGITLDSGEEYQVSIIISSQKIKCQDMIA
jgi:hypothetical protein